MLCGAYFVAVTACYRLAWTNAFLKSFNLKVEPEPVIFEYPPGMRRALQAAIATVKYFNQRYLTFPLFFLSPAATMHENQIKQLLAYISWPMLAFQGFQSAAFTIHYHGRRAGPLVANPTHVQCACTICFTASVGIYALCLLVK